ncbi:MAG: lytic transglycosylase domain-containing protein [Bryobacteraceae bacterium]
MSVSKNFLFCLILAAVPAMAGEYAVLSSGLRVHIDRHETASGAIRLYLKDGFTEVPATSVTRFEADDYVVPPAPPRVSVAPSPAPDAKALIDDAAVRYALPPAFVESVARVESALQANAVSPKGALGVMQLMPATARALDADPNNPAQNVDAGTRLLRELLLKYRGDAVKALAAYNAGAGAVEKYQGLPPYPETQNYVDKVLHKYLAAPAN